MPVHQMKNAVTKYAWFKQHSTEEPHILFIQGGFEMTSPLMLLA
jgi:hypothetical protein